MSNFIPMVSSSPPPMDDGGGFDWDDNDDDFGTFASAGDVNFGKPGHSAGGGDNSFNDTNQNMKNHTVLPGEEELDGFANFASFPVTETGPEQIVNNCVDDTGKIDKVNNEDQKSESIYLQNEMSSSTHSVSIDTSSESHSMSNGPFVDSGVYSSNVSPIQQSVDPESDLKSTSLPPQDKLDLIENRNAQTIEQKTCKTEVSCYIEENSEKSNNEQVETVVVPKTQEIDMEAHKETEPDLQSHINSGNCDNLSNDDIPQTCIPSADDINQPVTLENAIQDNSKHLKEFSEENNESQNVSHIVGTLDCESHSSIEKNDKTLSETTNHSGQNLESTMHNIADESAKDFEEESVESQEQKSEETSENNGSSCEQFHTCISGVTDDLDDSSADSKGVPRECDNKDSVQTDTLPDDVCKTDLNNTESENEPCSDAGPSSFNSAINEMGDTNSDSNNVPDISIPKTESDEFGEDEFADFVEPPKTMGDIGPTLNSETEMAIVEETHSDDTNESMANVKSPAESIETLNKNTDNGEENEVKFEQEDDDFGDFGDFNSSLNATAETKGTTDDWAGFTEATGNDTEEDNSDKTDCEWAAFSSPGNTKTETGETEEAEADDWAAFSQPQTTSLATADAGDADDWGGFGDDDEVDIKPTVTPTPTQPETDKLSSAQLQHMSKQEKLVYAVTTCFPSLVSDTDVSDPDQLSMDIFSDNMCSVWDSMKSSGMTDALTHQWSKSKWNTQLFSTLHVDTRNILIGHKKASVPVFAAGMAILEPIKGQLTPLKPDVLVDTSKSDLSSNNSQESIPAAQFDWSSSGLTNPLEANNKSLNLDFLIQEQATKSNELESEFLSDTSVPAPKSTIQPLENILANMKTTPTFKPTNQQPDTCPEAAKIVQSLPDLAFMKSHVLMFPVKMDN